VSHLSIHNDCCFSVNVELTYEHLQRLQLLSLSNCELRVKPALLQQGGAAPAEAQAPAPADAHAPAAAAAAAAAAAGLAAAPAAAFNPLADLTSLTGLELLKYGKVKGPNGRLPSTAVHALSALSRLRLLRLPDVEEQLLWLPELRQLTNLEVRAEVFRQGDGPGVAVPAPFSSMQQLQQLVITHDTHRCRSVYNAQLLEDLPRSLTRLEFEWAVADQLNDGTVPTLASLTAMQHLRILSSRRGHNSSHVLPQFLASMQNLRVLQLQGVNRDALPVLLEVMPALTQLEDLEISGVPREWPPFADADADEQPALQYSALLPSSPVLRRVVLHGVADTYYLPSGCAAQLFAPGRMFPGMHELRLTDTKSNLQAYEDIVFDPEQVPYVFEAEDLSRLVTCCPNLKTLCVPGTVQPGADFAPLLQLHAFTHLGLRGAAVTDDTAASVLRQLTGLQHLDITCSQGVTDVSLLSLTTLKQLTRLQLRDCGLTVEEEMRGSVGLNSSRRGRAKVSNRRQRLSAAVYLTL
jgi:hypothetical protein